MARRETSLRARTLLSSLVVALGCNGPLFLLPGGALEGESSAAPSDWSFAGDYGTAQLETHPDRGEPYSVNLAYTIMDGVLYVNAGGTETQWVKNMKVNPLVRLAVDGSLYDLRAERVTDQEEIAAFSGAWLAQSTFRRDPLGYEEVWIYRLVAR